MRTLGLLAVDLARGAVAIAALTMGCSAAIARAADSPPNVIILLADDLGWADVGYHGGPIETPSIDRLAAEGVQFDRFYVAPICSPTRAGIMTGRDPLKLGIGYDQIHPWYNAGLSPDDSTIADAFRDAGYQTGIVGKWHLGHTQEHQLPGAHGFDHFFGHLHTNTDFFAHVREGGHDLQKNGESVFEPGQYLTHIEAREAIHFIRGRDTDRPFFLYVPFTAPHSPMQAPAKTIEKYASFPKPRFRREYAAMVDEMDRAIGQILDVLDAEGIAPYTIVMFLSDNGGSNIFGGENQPLKGNKGQTFEGGIRVPAVIRWPGVLEPATVMKQVASGLDLLPTLTRAAGVAFTSKRPLDGQDMWPSLAEGKTVPRKAPLFFVSEIPLPGHIHLAVLDGPLKLVQVIHEGQTETQVRNFLYEIEKDPNETRDVSGEMPDQVERLAGLIHAWRSQHPMAGTRGTLVAHPGWVAPLDWAAAVVPSEKLQPSWKNELPFSKQLLDATAERGVLVDEETRKELIEAEERRRAAN